MKQTNNIKKTEKKILIYLLSFFTNIKKITNLILNLLYKIGSQRITILFIPHSEKKVFNFRINTFALFMFIFISIGTVIGITYISVKNINNLQKYSNAEEKTVFFKQRSKEYQELINEILYSHKFFQQKLNTLLTYLDSTIIQNMQEANQYKLNQGGPLNIFDTSQIDEFSIEKNEVNQLLNDYQYSIQAFSEVNKLAYNYKKLLKDLPFGSPVNGPYAITSGFGLRVHPIHKVLDMHQGIDLAYQAGTPIVATAPGMVEKVEWNPFGYGWYVKISHKLGFTTLYAHMRSQPLVIPGEKVEKGRIVGYMGSTGATTGVHVHYEIRLGDNLLDPLKFVSIY